jgi:DHA2 family multidrug resistance protein
MAYLSSHLTQTNPNFRRSLSQVAESIARMGTVAGDATQAAMGRVFKTLIAQAAFLAYIDVFFYCAILAFAFIPFTFLFSGVKASRAAGAG